MIFRHLISSYCWAVCQSNSCYYYCNPRQNGWGIGHMTPKVTGSTPSLAVSGNNLGQVVHTCASVTEQYDLVPVEGQ